MKGYLNLDNLKDTGTTVTNKHTDKKKNNRKDAQIYICMFACCSCHIHICRHSDQFLIFNNSWSFQWGPEYGL